MATFGYTNVGTEWDGAGTPIRCTRAQSLPAQSGTVNKISVYCKYTGINAGTLLVAIYAADGSGGLPGTLLASNSVGVTMSNTASWQDVSISCSIVSGTQYWLAAKCIAGESSNWSFYCDDGSTGDRQDQTWSGSWPNPFGTPSASGINKISIYATYTPVVTSDKFFQMF